MKPDPDAIGRALPFETLGWRGLRDERVDEATLRAAVSAHEGAPGSPPCERLKDDTRSLVTACQAADLAVVVKEVRKAGIRRRLADGVRGSAARRGFRAARRLIESGIGAALPLAAVEKRRARLPTRSLLVSYDLRNDPTAAALLSELAGEPPSADDRGGDRAEVLRALAELLASLHRAGARHGDLRTQHTHCATRPGGGWTPRLIDLESLSSKRSPCVLREDARLDDWAQMNGSIPDAHASLEERRAAFAHYARELAFTPRFGAGGDWAFEEMIRRSIARRHLYQGL